MKNKCKNPYATNKGGKIEAPKTPSGNDPGVTRTVAGSSGDLRSPRGKK